VFVPAVPSARAGAECEHVSANHRQPDCSRPNAQREACEAFIASQRPEGWVLVPDRYDDGGVSGGTLERPALQRLLRDVEHGLVDVVVVYKIDRLSRSLSDFSTLVADLGMRPEQKQAA
jgi:site-specific DNA recombinase